MDEQLKFKNISLYWKSMRQSRGLLIAWQIGDVNFAIWLSQQSLDSWQYNVENFRAPFKYNLFGRVGVSLIYMRLTWLYERQSINWLDINDATAAFSVNKSLILNCGMFTTFSEPYKSYENFNRNWKVFNSNFQRQLKSFCYFLIFNAAVSFENAI